MEVNNDLNREIPILDWESHLAERTKGMGSSVIRELLKFTQDPDIISFAGGLPAPELFPTREVEEACIYVAREQGRKALQYGATEGYLPLKEYLAASIHKYGIPAFPEKDIGINGFGYSGPEEQSTFWKCPFTLFWPKFGQGIHHGVPSFFIYLTNFINVRFQDAPLADIIRDILDKSADMQITALLGLNKPLHKCL